ncbi:hypothetical protein [Lactiplantibacillus fabifermentans]|uniref:Abc superfamily atp binding cassette transporter, permease protein n=2 Tax=Lactiplantibacillus fabifermentans TaxID=483011 RepID=A0A0R2NQT7_9LACO|nr:hypothetical protein [Lactiplantibacillus fabifermentans]ETY73493.1 ABC transporter permease [Lactiplantibacillus fabifermentans T30PCM01]KRO27234.1 abc superfamily atp binding cassette transporter, permease protein [Lactiplantibacillus fabifermentans DSM 21115]
MSTKVRALTRYYLLDQLKYLGWVYALLIATFALLPALFALISGSFTAATLPNNLSDLGVGVIFWFFIFITMSLTYENFKLCIQNGISRRTYFKARVITLLLLSLIGVLIATIYYFGVTANFQHHSALKALLVQPYGGLYGRFFGSNVFINIVGYVVFTWIFMVGTGLTGMAIGGALSLLTTGIRRLVIVVVPILGFFALILIANISSSRTYPNDVDTPIEKLFKFLIGYNADGAAGSFNPTVPVITMIIGCLVMGAIAYYVNQKLKVKN